MAEFTMTIPDNVSALEPGSDSPTAVLICLLDVADLLAQLVERSMVVFDHATGRYHLLETVKQFAQGKLAPEEARLVIDLPLKRYVLEEFAHHSWKA